jgi:1,4-dihydroxy-2-naphthoyl-CoA synthase
VESAGWGIVAPVPDGAELATAHLPCVTRSPHDASRATGSDFGVSILQSTQDGVRTTRDSAILEVALDRPKANAIDLPASRRLNAIFTAFRDDPALRVAIVTGTGEKFFSPGWDLKNAARGEPSDSDWGVGGFAGLNYPRNIDKPIIAAVNGIACVVDLSWFLVPTSL